MTELRWTPLEERLFAEVVRHRLRASLDGAEPQPAGVEGFSAEPHQVMGAAQVELRFDAERVSLSLDSQAVSGHRWRDTWAVEIVRDDARYALAPGDPPIELSDARRGPFRAELRLRPRWIEGELDGRREQVPITDGAFLRWVRQSSVASAPPRAVAPWMDPTEPEASPWWEIDLNQSAWIAGMRFDLADLPEGSRVVVNAFPVARPSGAMWAQFVVADVAASSLRDGRLDLSEPVVARFVRVTLVAPAGARCVLALTAAEILVAPLFPETLAASYRRAFFLHAARPLTLARGDDGAYAPHRTYGHVYLRAMAFALGLAWRIEVAGERPIVGVMTRNRLEWVIAEVAIVARGYLMVSMSPDDNDERLASVIERARPACVICEADDAERVRRLGGDSLKLVVVCDLRVREKERVGFDDLVIEGATSKAIPAAERAPEEPYCVLFTSGSTGPPKGAVRSYRAFLEMIKSYGIGHSPRHLSYQPLSHLSERMYLPAVLMHGGSIAFAQGGPRLLEELRAFEPTTIGTVPRLFEVIHAAYERRLRQARASAGASTEQASREAMREARAALGARIIAINIGSAPVSAEVLAFVRECFEDVWVSEGYGSTELGTIAYDGRVPADVTVRLVPLADEAPAAEGAPARGEIYARTPHMISGYLGDPEATSAAVDKDGFFATGDLGERGADGLVRVVGRVRNTVKLAQGEFVSIERVELALAAAPLVDRVCVQVSHGAPRFAALVLPRAEPLGELLGAPGASLAALVGRPEAADAVLRELRAQGRLQGLRAFELPSAVLLTGEALSVANGLLTVSGKLSRQGLAARFGGELDELSRRAFEENAPTGDDPLERMLRAASRAVGRAVGAGEALAGSVSADSLTTAEVLAAIGEELGREVPLAYWFASATLEELAARLLSSAAPVAGHAARSQARSDLALRSSARPAAAPRPIRRVLLTGATGFLGGHLVASLRARGVEVCCLVRAPSDAAARERVARSLASRGLAAALDASVRACAGDLAAPTSEPLRAIEDVDAIVHAGAAVSWLAPYERLRAPNVLGTLALIELASERGIALHHISTVSTAPPDGDEDSSLPFEGALASGPYALSKWVAEQHVRRAHSAGLGGHIYRPAMIAADTRRGLGNPDDFLSRYLSGCAELGEYIDRDDAVIDMTPVDFVAEAIVALLLSPPERPRTWNLANVDQSLSYASLGRAMSASGVVLRPVSYEVFRASLGARTTSRLKALAAFFPEDFSLGTGPWPCARTVATLASLGVERPPIDAEFIGRWVRAIGLSGGPEIDRVDAAAKGDEAE